MKCRHCLAPVFTEREQVGVINSDNHLYVIDTSICPKCGNASIYLSRGKAGATGATKDKEYEEILLYPKNSPKSLAPKQAPQDIRDDFHQAGLILELSPSASAAISRRCFRKVLRDKGDVTPDRFSTEIQQILHSKSLPPAIHKQIEVLGTMHDYASHPVFDKNPSILVNIKPTEAVLWFEALESLLHLYYPDE